MKLLYPLMALLLAGCSQVSTPTTAQSAAAPVAAPSHEVLPDGNLRVTGTFDADLTGPTQLRMVNAGVVTFETVGAHQNGAFTAVITPEQVKRNTGRFDYIRLQTETMGASKCTVNTLVPSTQTRGGYWFQYLYVNGQDGGYRYAHEWVGDVYRVRSTAYVYAETEESLTGEADCMVMTHRGLVRHRLSADLHFQPGWNVIRSESLRPRNEDVINMSIRMGDDPEVPWIRP